MGTPDLQFNANHTCMHFERIVVQYDALDGMAKLPVSALYVVVSCSLQPTMLNT